MLRAKPSNLVLSLLRATSHHLRLLKYDLRDGTLDDSSVSVPNRLSFGSKHRKWHRFPLFVNRKGVAP